MQRVPREFQLHTLTGAEPNDYGDSLASIHPAMFGMVVGIAVTLIVTLLTAVLDEGTRSMFVAALVAVLILAIYFGASTCRDVVRARQKVRVIRTERGS